MFVVDINCASFSNFVMYWWIRVCCVLIEIHIYLDAKKECLEAPQCRRVKRNCPCGVLAKYGLVPSELGVGLYCGHTLTVIL